MVDTKLLSLLAHAQKPCSHFEGVCLTCKWDPKNGFIPRGYGGATGNLAEVRLVLITAEPGNPGDVEKGIYLGTPEQIVKRHLEFFNGTIERGTHSRDGRPTPFHRNLTTIFDRCWPNLSWSERLRKTWFTNSVMCSLPDGKSDFTSDVVGTCISSYLVKQIALFQKPYVVALGAKARKRLRGIRVDHYAYHPSNREPTIDKEESWRKLGDSFRAWLGPEA